ncbi:DinB family protein [Neobacillus niacini]|uniref:DinB family protein n=1 Tax=Neobacillus niacini TaxID=86668 RepID=UPI0005EDAA66|nr:DinB family protein [Neobacillus niacini]
MEKLLEEYSHGYQLLRKAIEGLTEEELRFKPEADKWSIHQILIHVADSELVSTQRIKKVLSEEAPLLNSFDQDAWANTLGYEQLDREQHLLLFKLLRSSMLPILAQLPAQQWERVGVYADAGPFTVKELLEYRVEHVLGHLAQIKRVKEAYRESQK